MSRHRTTVLIIMHSDPLRAALKALLSVLPGMAVVAEADVLAAGLALAAEFQPDIVLADAGANMASALAVLEQIKAVSPGSRRVLLADDALPAPGRSHPAAEAILLKGTPPAELLAAIELLTPRGDSRGHDHGITPTSPTGD
jgi:DNA-binding NarL/FixJ family response regulator